MNQNRTTRPLLAALPDSLPDPSDSLARPTRDLRPPTTRVVYARGVRAAEPSKTAPKVAS